MADYRALRHNSKPAVEDPIAVGAAEQQAIRSNSYTAPAGENLAIKTTEENKKNGRLLMIELELKGITTGPEYEQARQMAEKGFAIPKKSFLGTVFEPVTSILKATSLVSSAVQLSLYDLMDQGQRAGGTSTGLFSYEGGRGEAGDIQLARGIKDVYNALYKNDASAVTDPNNPNAIFLRDEGTASFSKWLDTIGWEVPKEGFWEADAGTKFNKSARFVASLGGDVATDPISYAAFGTSGSSGQIAKATLKVTKEVALEATADMVKTGVVRAGKTAIEEKMAPALERILAAVKREKLAMVEKGASDAEVAQFVEAGLSKWAGEAAAETAAPWLKAVVTRDVKAVPAEIRSQIQPFAAGIQGGIRVTPNPLYGAIQGSSPIPGTSGLGRKITRGLFGAAEDGRQVFNLSAMLDEKGAYDVWNKTIKTTAGRVKQQLKKGTAEGVAAAEVMLNNAARSEARLGMRAIAHEAMVVINDSTSRLKGVKKEDRVILNRILTEGIEGGMVPASNIPIHQVGNDKFRAVLNTARQESKRGRKISETVDALGEGRNIRTFLSEDERTGYALVPHKDGGVEVVALFNVGGKGNGEEALKDAIGRGATRLNAFDEEGFLPDMYAKLGFVQDAKYEWNPKFAPEGWTGGTPDVVDMSLKSHPLQQALKAELPNLTADEAAAAMRMAASLVKVRKQLFEKAVEYGIEIGKVENAVPLIWDTKFRLKVLEPLMGGSGNDITEAVIAASQYSRGMMWLSEAVAQGAQRTKGIGKVLGETRHANERHLGEGVKVTNLGGNVTMVFDLPAERVFESHAVMNEQILGAAKELMARSKNLPGPDSIVAALEMDVAALNNKYTASLTSAIAEKFAMRSLSEAGAIVPQAFRTDIGGTLAELVRRVASVRDKRQLDVWQRAMVAEIIGAEGVAANPMRVTGKMHVPGIGEIEVPASIARLAKSKRPTRLRQALERAGREDRARQRAASSLERDRTRLQGVLVAAKVPEAEATAIASIESLSSLRRVVGEVVQELRETARVAGRSADEVSLRMVEESVEGLAAIRGSMRAKKMLARETAKAADRVVRQLEAKTRAGMRAAAKTRTKATRLAYMQFDSPEASAQLADGISGRILEQLDSLAPETASGRAAHDAVRGVIEEFRTAMSGATSPAEREQFFAILGERLKEVRKGAVGGLDNTPEPDVLNRLAGFARDILKAVKAADVIVPGAARVDVAALDHQAVWRLVQDASTTLDGAIRNLGPIKQMVPAQRAQLKRLAAARAKVDALLDSVRSIADLAPPDMSWREYLSDGTLFEQFEVLRLLAQNKKVYAPRLRTRLELMLRESGLIGDEARLVVDPGSHSGVAIQAEDFTFHTLGQAADELARKFPKGDMDLDRAVRLARVHALGETTAGRQLGSGEDVRHVIMSRLRQMEVQGTYPLHPAGEGKGFGERITMVVNSVEYEARFFDEDGMKAVIWKQVNGESILGGVYWSDAGGGMARIGGPKARVGMLDSTVRSIRESRELGPSVADDMLRKVKADPSMSVEGAGALAKLSGETSEAAEKLMNRSGLSEETKRALELAGDPSTPFEQKLISDMDDAVRAARRAQVVDARTAKEGASKIDAAVAASAKGHALARELRHAVLGPLNRKAATRAELDQAATTLSHLLPELKESTLPSEHAAFDILSDLLDRRRLVAALPDDPLARRIADRALETRKLYSNLDQMKVSVEALTADLAAAEAKAMSAERQQSLRMATEMKDILMEVLGLDADAAGRTLSVFPTVEQEAALTKLLARGERVWNRLFDESSNPFKGVKRRSPVSEVEGFVPPSSVGLTGEGWDSVLGDKVMLEWMHDMTAKLVSLSTPEGFGKFAQFHQITQRLWAGSATVARPTFHMRNFIGAGWNNMLADVRVSDYAQAVHVARFLTALRTNEVGGALDTVPAKLRVKYLWAEKSGVFADTFSSTEIIDSSLVKHRFIQSPGKGHLMQAGGRVMEQIEGYHRMAAFIRHFDDTALDLEGAAAYAKSWVDTVQFNYSDLTGQERVMKQIFPFFVWTRRNLPLQMQFLLERPAIIQRYRYLIDAHQANFGDDSNMDDLPPNQYRASHFVSYYGKDNLGGDENSPFWAQLIFDPDLPTTILTELGNPLSPSTWVTMIGNQLGPAFDLAGALAAGDENYKVNAPGGLGQIMGQMDRLMPGQGFMGATNEDGVTRMTSGSAQVTRLLFPAVNELGGFAFDQDARRRQALGQPEMQPGGDTLRQDLGALVNVLGRGFGRQLQGVDESYNTAVGSSFDLEGTRRELKKGNHVSDATREVAKMLLEEGLTDPGSIESIGRPALEQILLALQEAQAKTASGS